MSLIESLFYGTSVTADVKRTVRHSLGLRCSLKRLPWKRSSLRRTRLRLDWLSCSCSSGLLMVRHRDQPEWSTVDGKTETSRTRAGSASVDPFFYLDMWTIPWVVRLERDCAVSLLAVVPGPRLPDAAGWAYGWGRTPHPLASQPDPENKTHQQAEPGGILLQFSPAPFLTNNIVLIVKEKCLNTLVHYYVRATAEGGTQ